MKWRICLEILFWALIAFNLLPVFGVFYFYTGDGPAHVYNASMINEIVLYDNQTVKNYLELRSGLIPNVGAHYLLCVLLLIFNSVLASKIFFAICVVLIPLGVKAILSKLNGELTWGIFFCFMLVHHFCLYIGFMGFSLAMGIMLFTLAAFINYYLNRKLKSAVLLSILLFGTAICHMVPALFAIIFCCLYELPRILRQKFDFTLLLASIPAVVLIVFFLFDNAGHNVWESSSFIDSLKSLASLQAFISYSSEQKWPVILYLCLLALVMLIRNKKPLQHNTFLFTGLILLLCFFILPDNLASGGFISIRMVLGFMFFTVLWIILNSRNSKTLVVFAFAAIALNCWQVVYNFKIQKYLSADAEKVLQVAPFLEKNSRVMTLLYSDHWLHYNLGLVPGAVKPLLMMDNYEAAAPHFPLKWKKGMNPEARLGMFGSTRRPPFSLQPFEYETGERIDAVVRIAYKDDFRKEEPTATVNNLLDSAFIKMTDLEYVEFWKRK